MLVLCFSAFAFNLVENVNEKLLHLPTLQKQSGMPVLYHMHM